MSKASPWPWRRKPGANDANMIVGADGRPVGTAYYTDEETTEANLRLLIAAPELLEALRKLLPLIHTINDDGSAIDAAEALIAKVEG